METHSNKNFNSQHAVHAKINKKRITKQKTTIITPYEELFGRRRNLSACNIATKLNSKNLNYNNLSKN